MGKFYTEGCCEPTPDGYEDQVARRLRGHVEGVAQESPPAEAEGAEEDDEGEERWSEMKARCEVCGRSVEGQQELPGGSLNRATFKPVWRFVCEGTGQEPHDKREWTEVEGVAKA